MPWPTHKLVTTIVTHSMAHELGFNNEVATNSESGLVGIGFLWVVGHYDAAIRYLLSSFRWDVGFVYEKYGVGSFRFSGHPLGEKPQLFAVVCRVELAILEIFHNVTVLH